MVHWAGNASVTAMALWALFWNKICKHRLFHLSDSLGIEVATLGHSLDLDVCHHDSSVVPLKLKHKKDSLNTEVIQRRRDEVHEKACI